MSEPASPLEPLVCAVGDAATLLRRLSNETRLLILCQLSEGDLTVSELLDRLPYTQPALSQHLAVLRDAGIVSARRKGQSIHYHIADPAALKVIETLACIYCLEDPA